ncbi:MAG: hypothetical protein ACYDCC_08560 [Actinomycetota bacterium]
MPETPIQFYERVAGSLRMPPVGEWDTFPFDGEMRPRALRPPSDVDPPRSGDGGVDCKSCSKNDDEFVWTNDAWRLKALKPNGLPLILLMESRAHFGEPGDLADDVAADLGRMIARIERAVRSLEGIGRVHVCRWGDGAEHLHWWFIARPACFPQLLGSFAAVWDDILPPTPDEIWQANIDHVVRALDAD